MAETFKKEWATPQVTLLGGVEVLTQQKLKAFGGNDGFSVGNPPQTISG